MDVTHSVSFEHSVFVLATFVHHLAVRGFGQGLVCGAVSSGPYDDIEEDYEGRGVLQAVESSDQLLSEILLGKDPKQQAKIDKLLTQESLPGNVVSAASIACCKAGAKQAFVSVFDHVSTMCNNSDGRIPGMAFSVINGGQSAASSLWVQVIKFKGKKVVASSGVRVYFQRPPR